MDVHNQTEMSEINQISIQVIDASNKHQIPHYNLYHLAKTIPNLAQNQHFIDYHFKLATHKSSSITIKRLSEIYPPMTNLFLDLKTGKQLNQPTKNKINHFIPTYLSEINMLPFRHFCKLIQPAFVNQRGFYYVVVLREGVLVKQIIDDRFYYDQKSKTIVTHSQLEDHPWVHILIKAWAKINKGYQNLNDSRCFSFLKTFSFPDWQLMNPNKEKIESIIGKLSKATSKHQYLIAKTKNNKKVGFFGFAPNCCSYMIKGHYQQYGNIFIKLVPFVYGGWNSVTSKNPQVPQQIPHLEPNQFLVPLPQFLNNFHLIYSTTNKYFRSENTFHYNHQQVQIVQQISYEKYAVHIDAMESTAHVIGFDVQSKVHSTNNLQVGLSFYFPEVSVHDLIGGFNNKFLYNQNVVVPWCKIMIGRIQQSSNADVNFVESVKQKIMQCQEQDHMSFTVQNRQHDYIVGDYFKGYAHELTHILDLKPGKYLIRIKMQQKKLEYRCFLTATTINGYTKLYDPKIETHEQIILLQDCLYKKAISQKKCITFVNPTKRGSWISCRDQYEILGYSYIAVYVIKNSDNKIAIKISPNKLKQNGYVIKGHKDMKDYDILVDSQQSAIVILKPDKQWKGNSPKLWPPPGIQFMKIPRIHKQPVEKITQSYNK